MVKLENLFIITTLISLMSRRGDIYQKMFDKKSYNESWKIFIVNLLLKAFTADIKLYDILRASGPWSQVKNS